MIAFKPLGDDLVQLDFPTSDSCEVHILFSYDNKLPISIHLNNTAGLMFFAALPAILHYIINGILNLFADFIKSLWGGFATNVGTRADDGLLETETEFLAEFFLRDADASTAVFGYHVRSQTCHVVKNDGQWPFAQFNHVPSDICHIPDIALQTHVAVHQADECLAVLSLLDSIHFLNSFLSGMTIPAAFTMEVLEITFVNLSSVNPNEASETSFKSEFVFESFVDESLPIKLRDSTILNLNKRSSDVDIHEIYLSVLLDL